MKFMDEHPDIAAEAEKAIREYFKENSSYSDTTEIGSSGQSDDGSPDSDSLSSEPIEDIKEEDLITPFPDDL